MTRSIATIRLVGAFAAALVCGTAEAWSLDVDATPSPLPFCAGDPPTCTRGTYITSGSGVQPGHDPHGIAIAGSVTVARDPASPDSPENDAVVFRIDNTGRLLWQATAHSRKVDFYRFARSLPDGGMLAAGLGNDGASGDATLLLTRHAGDGSVQWQHDGTPAIPGLQDIVDVKLANHDGDAFVVMSVDVGTDGTNLMVARVNGDGSVPWVANGTPSESLFPLRSTLLPDGTLIVEATDWPNGPDRYLGFRGSDGALLWDVPSMRGGQRVDSIGLGVRPDGRLMLGTFTVDQQPYVVGLMSLDATGQLEDHGTTTLPAGSALTPMRMLPNGNVFLLRSDPDVPSRHHLGQISADDMQPTWHALYLPPTHRYHYLHDNGTEIAVLSYYEDGAEMRHEIRGVTADGHVRWLHRIGPEFAQVPRYRFVYGPRDITFVQNVAVDGNQFNVQIRATRIGVPLHNDDFESAPDASGSQQ